MSTWIAIPGNTADTFLVHSFGSDLADEPYVVVRFEARADCDFVSAPAEAPDEGRAQVRDICVREDAKISTIRHTCERLRKPAAYIGTLARGCPLYGEPQDCSDAGRDRRRTQGHYPTG